MHFLAVSACIVIYFLPAILGFLRKKKTAGGILLINLFFGITVLGWILAMALVFKSDTFLKKPSKHTGNQVRGPKKKRKSR